MYGTIKLSLLKRGSKLLTRSHRLVSVAIVEFGLIASNQFLIKTSPSSALVLLCATAIGATLPDIDDYNSSASRKSLINFSLFLRHRGITHSLIGWGIFSLLLYFLMSKIMPLNLEELSSFQHPNCWLSLWLGFSIGYFLHLVEDAFSHHGINWLAPFTNRKKYRRFFHYKVGGFFEKLLTLIAVLAIIFMTGYWLLNFINIK